MQIYLKNLVMVLYFTTFSSLVPDFTSIIDLYTQCAITISSGRK